MPADVELNPLATAPQRAELAVLLHASEPFLNDHRPGGQPLLGTAMGIELMFRAVRAMASGWAPEPRRFEQVKVFAPLILQHPTATVHVRAECVANSGRAAIRCVVESRNGAEPPVPHFEALCVDAQPGTAEPHPHPHTGMPTHGATNLPFTVNAADVYAVFFHGPAFRVVAAATRVGGEMVCEWQPALPAWTHAPTNAAQPDPRWLELCLQTAGLLELATTQRMLIPKRIASVEHGAAPERGTPGRVFAHAKRSEAGAAIDITLEKQDGTRLLHVRGYRTEPLPFSSDAVALQALARRFNAAASTSSTFTTPPP